MSRDRLPGFHFDFSGARRASNILAWLRRRPDTPSFFPAAFPAIGFELLCAGV